MPVFWKAKTIKIESPPFGTDGKKENKIMKTLPHGGITAKTLWKA